MQNGVELKLSPMFDAPNYYNLLSQLEQSGGYGGYAYAPIASQYASYVGLEERCFAWTVDPVISSPVNVNTSPSGSSAVAPASNPVSPSVNAGTKSQGSR